VAFFPGRKENSAVLFLASRRRLSLPFDPSSVMKARELVPASAAVPVLTTIL
jgi:hypothetical protein